MLAKLRVESVRCLSQPIVGLFFSPFEASSNKVGLGCVWGDLGCVYYYSLMADEPRPLVHGLVCQGPP